MTKFFSKISVSLFIVLLAAVSLSAFGETGPEKREFRGAWLHVIGQSQYQDMSTARCKAYIQQQLDRLQSAGCNAVIFQVRPCADALYKSDLEPWSNWLTGRRGKAPDPMWDPMQFTLDEAHKRGMEFHAWLNPYRVSSNLSKDNIPADHDSKKHPERYFKYDGKLFFDPAYQENRDFICKVVEDIMTRYDVDAIHIDDYFYPYPVAGNPLTADAASYAKFGNGMNKNDWRRRNVDLLIEQLHKTIRNTKPWVRFGISPFGIWRNKKNDSRGSNSNGLQNYDDLYADILMWADKGWVDYLAPQLYWNLDLQVAPSRHLAEWWNNNVKAPVQLYIGQDTKRTMDV
ncbi:MAG: family 10 glycosylhydrolase, partial [Muribaculaceae bacterium]|nr:family 10 glycosylhydrolase [Muribaculaceae bacterium]